MPKAMADGRMLEKSSPMPLDGKRLIYGGFETLVEGRGPAKRSRHHVRHHPIPTGHEHRRGHRLVRAGLRYDGGSRQIGGPDGTCMNAEIKIEDIRLKLADEMPKIKLDDPRDARGNLGRPRSARRRLRCGFPEGARWGCRRNLPARGSGSVLRRPSETSA